HFPIPIHFPISPFPTDMPAISVFDIFKIGVGPSSSHFMGPWRAAQACIVKCGNLGLFGEVVGIHVDLYGSLAKTGRGHGTDRAIMLGLLGEDPVTCDTTRIPATIEGITKARRISLGGAREIPFD